MDAARIAGLHVLRLVNESSASAINHVFIKTSSNPRNILIVDLGGGMLDVSLVLVDGGVVEVSEIGGDLRLGGEDFDDRLVDHFLEEIKQIRNEDMSTDLRATNPPERTWSSLVARFAFELISDLFDGRPLCKTLDPEEAVVHGAAIYAAVLSGEDMLRDLLCMEVTPHSLRGETADGFLPILKLWASDDDVPMDDAPSDGEKERTVEIKVLESESTQAYNNTLLTSFDLPLSPGSKIGIAFEVYTNAETHVIATDQATGK
ncbi:heat shock protein 70 [Mycena sanguinolenta]|nr:heat shock protein 70 [Mycena sanguinolenta]